MSYSHHASHRDLVEPEIVNALEAIGAQVWRKLPADLLVYRLGRFYVLEVKDPKARKDKRQKAQQAFLDLTHTPIVRTADDALRAVGAG